MDKVPALVCNKRVIESLVKAGAFDDMKHQRRALVAIHETAVDQYVDIKRNEAIGQDSLFDGLDDDGGSRLRHLRRHPRHRRVGQDDAARPRARDARPLRLRPPAARPRARAVRRHRLHHRPADARRGAPRRRRRSPISGLVTSVQRKITKRGDAWAMVTLEDLDGAIDVLLFPSAYQLASTLPHRGRDHHGQGPALAAARTSPSCTARRSPSPTSPTGRPARS